MFVYLYNSVSLLLYGLNVCRHEERTEPRRSGIFPISLRHLLPLQNSKDGDDLERPFFPLDLLCNLFTMSAQSEPHKGSPLQRADHRNNAPAETNLASSLTSAKALIALQLLSRLITFSLNQALIRIASPKVFGTAAVQFDLVRDTILFLSREGVRAVVIRIPGERKVQGNQAAEWIQDTRIHNLVHLPAVFGIIVAGGLLPIYLQSLPTTTTSQSYFHSSLALYVVATLVELVTEPFYLASQLSTPVNTGIRVQAEGTAIIVRAIVTVVCLAAASDRYALLAFAVGQLAYSVTLGGRYVRAYWNHGSLWRMPFRQST